MLREKLKEKLKENMLAKDAIATSTIRLIMASLKDRDIAERSKGNVDGISEADILSMLQTMIKQRRESIVMYEKGGRPELAKREGEEIEIIERFLPRQMSEADIIDAVSATMKEIDAEELKDMGKVMARLKELYVGQMDFARASGLVKEKLLASII